MSLLWFDGFEYGSMSVLNSFYNASPYLQMASPFTGIYGLSTAGASHASGYIARQLETAKAEFYIKFHYSPITVSGSGAVCGFYKGSTCLGWVQQVAKTLKFFMGSGTGSQLGSTSGNVLGPLGTNWSMIEVRLKLSDTEGMVEVKVNGAIVITFGPGDTKPGADADMDIVYLLACGGSGNNGYSPLVDDFLIDDADWIGNKRVYKIQPNAADASYTEWDPSTAPNWDCVNEIPYNDADYVSTNVTGEIDLYGCSDLPANAIACFGLMLMGRTQAEGAPTPKNVQLACRANSINYFGDSFVSPPGSPQFFTKTWLQHPSGSGNWSVSDISAVEIGVKSVA